MRNQQFLKIALVAVGSLIAMTMDLATFSDRQLDAPSPRTPVVLVAENNGANSPDEIRAQQRQFVPRTARGQDLASNKGSMN